MYQPAVYKLLKIFVVVLIFELKVKIDIFWVSNTPKTLISGKNTKF